MVNRIVSRYKQEETSTEGRNADVWLGGLPVEIVRVELWPRLMKGSSGQNDMKGLGKLRTTEWQLEMATIQG
jgi:hypothetical protein